MTAPAAPFCRLKDQKPLSQEAYQHSRRLRDQIRALVAGRPDFLRAARRSPDVHLPHGDWELDGPRYDGYRAVADGDYAVLNHLRLFTQRLTGHSLPALAGLADDALASGAPADLDERLAERDAAPAPEVDAYLDLAAQLPEILHLAPPHAFGEIGRLVNGAIVNQDAVACLESVALLAASGQLWELRHLTPERAALRGRPWKRPRVVEIGSGHGGLAYHLGRLIPQARLYLVDLPESLLFAAVYLSALAADGDHVLITPDNLHDFGKDTPGFTFVPNFLFDDLCATGVECDLALSTFALSEMTERQARHYCKGVSRLLGRRGVFFEQHRDEGPAGGPGAKTVLANFFRLGLPLNAAGVPAPRGPAHLWADTPVQPHVWLPTAAALAPGAATAWPPFADDLPHLIEQGVRGVNVIYYRGEWFGLPQGCGPFDPLRVKDKAYPELYRADTKEQLKKAIRAARPCVRASQPRRMCYHGPSGGPHGAESKKRRGRRHSSDLPQQAGVSRV